MGLLSLYTHIFTFFIILFRGHSPAWLLLYSALLFKLLIISRDSEGIGAASAPASPASTRFLDRIAYFWPSDYFFPESLRQHLGLWNLLDLLDF